MRRTQSSLGRGDVIVVVMLLWLAVAGVVMLALDKWGLHPLILLAPATGSVTGILLRRRMNRRGRETPELRPYTPSDGDANPYEHTAR